MSPDEQLITDIQNRIETMLDSSAKRRDMEQHLQDALSALDKAYLEAKTS